MFGEQLPSSALVYDISFSYYGQRFATCSGDNTIKIWDYNNNEGKSINVILICNNNNNSNNNL